MHEAGRTLVALGLALLAAGALLLLAARLNWLPGRLPGDLHWRGRHTEVWFPLGASLLLSLLLSALLALFHRLRR